MKSKRFAHLLLPALAALALVACQNDDPVSSNDSLNATEDAAESIASAVGADNGGATDQLSDVIELAGASGLQKPAEVLLGKYSEPNTIASIDTSYDPATGTWTLRLERERGNPNGIPYAEISRTYTYQFLNKNGQPQKYWKVGADTAYTIKFNIVEGTGTHRTRRLSQQLTGLSGSFTATGVNTRLVTINGTYFRSAVDTVTTRNAVRTLDHALNLTFTNVQGPRGSRLELSRKISGTVSGTYTAKVTFQRGESYGETTINRSFTINLGGGNATLNISGKNFEADLTSGELK
ncbi:hypothetical protein EDS67_20665 [candidate division KSB1 bacterium]|nr:MAG: hypothetical protein EDS67_20665 [candidate division KSB1 bacterium]MBC6950293.1 hypothetical protein [candidate division KSB1 bacterium]MCE7943795.1 hypothetical protein [Chlorobi bacterium CHB1]MDL1874941.1 hypothetical protein [Cytophagia bacterium CHB2]RIK75292.1 MAG: hypothetical protein DCC62_13620 [candidate division KSB1 bacterium]